MNWFPNRPSGIGSALDDLSATASNIENLRKNFSGPSFPDNPVMGQAWYKDLGNNLFEIYMFNGTDWELVLRANEKPTLHSETHISGGDDELSDLNGLTVGDSTVESQAGAQAKVDTHESKVSPHSGHEKTSNKNQANGYAGLDSNKRIDTTQLPLPLVLPGVFYTKLQTIDENTTADNNYSVYLVNTSSGNITITLPSASTCKGVVYVVKKIDENGNSVIITPEEEETIEGLSGLSLSAQYDYVIIVSDGSNWYKIGENT